MSDRKKYNMHGHIIQYDEGLQAWTWYKWDLREGFGKRELVRYSGTLQFKKLFPSVFPGVDQPVGVTPSRDIDAALEESGVDYVFLFQGDSRVETRFKSVEEAEKFHKVSSCEAWNLTDYWFGFDWRMHSWAMYDCGSGDIHFTPGSAIPGRMPVDRNKPAGLCYVPRSGRSAKTLH
ncbi:MAG: hypothetical protein GY765_29375 [bacterium]|nr:hypothetical protein [bacterium]